MNSSEMQPRIQPSPRLPESRPKTWTPLELVRWTTDYFRKKGLESARLEAELLLAGVLQCDRINLYTDFEMPVEKDALALYRSYVKRRAETREPLQYILGHAEFLGLRVGVRPGVLIPRPETEQLAEWAIKTFHAVEKEPIRILDLGTGSGCLALGIASELSKAVCTATDVSEAALAVARENAEATQLQERVAFLAGDLFEALAEDAKGSFDLIVSNPPYIDPAKRPTLQPEVRDHEPPEALFADDKGQAVLKRVVVGARPWLVSQGKLALEISPEQAGSVQALLEAESFGEIVIHKDHQGLERFVTACRIT